ncbi:DUF6843 domain-containing protein [Fictibacillus norfolkensis]|uniref:DUF6843 domain-containing protein n=1 Tax=Fictibacillus norfolkensis TaxID=2762233 RepID=A0ABR8SN91_9BACL|nr:hypothetical protein [Fictibacillus norfolkensis]MBD7964957.1 hypothetical protein [Fictibacillus norfolkensis]
MSGNLSRKIDSALFSAFLLPGLLSFYFIYDYGFSEDLFILLIILFFTLVGNFFYAIPVSILIDWITKSIRRSQFFISGFLHIFFGFITIFIIERLNFFAITCAVLFFLSEEWQKRKKNPFNWIIVIKNGVVLVGIVTLAVYSSFLLEKWMEKETYEYYLIPANYEGEVTVIYNIKEEPVAKKMGKYNVIQVNDHGYALTSLRQAEGTIKNKYYFVDKNGEKVKIDEKCVHIGSSGSISNDEQEFHFLNLTVKKNGCTDDFYINGNMYGENHSLEIEEILQREGLGDFGY